MTASKSKSTVVEALKILTAPGGPCDPYDSKRPEMALMIVREVFEEFAAENPVLCQQSSAEELVEMFLQHLTELKKYKREEWTMKMKHK